MKGIFEEYLTFKEVADFLGITEKTLKNRMAAGKNHPPFIPGRVRKIRREAFDQWLRQYEVKQVNKVRKVV